MIDEIGRRLIQIRGVAAVALGGSRARGAQGPQVLRELGYHDQVIARLLDEGVVTMRGRLIQGSSDHD